MENLNNPSRDAKIEKQKQYNKTFYEKHKANMLKTVECPCGGKFSVYTKCKHERTKKHLKYKAKSN
jgi:hypothetical protein